jgi:AAA family ATP:ADP antiporter
MFLDAFGAKNTPVVWLYSIIGLTLCITIYNYFQVRLTAHKLYYWTCCLSVLFFLAGPWLVGLTQLFIYPLFVWKEIYIVLLIHMSIGYLNNAVKEDQAKIFYGPIGAIGSLGGILGGVLGSNLTNSINTDQILMTGALFLLVSIFFFRLSSRDFCLSKNKDNRGDVKPLQAIGEVKDYVILMALIVLLSQFVINLANFKFNILFDALVESKREKTKNLNIIYSSINAISLLVQIFVIPFLFQLATKKTVHQFIPIFYLLVAFVGFILSGSSLIAVAATFVFFKGLDYSIFSTAKELLYFPLGARQKYGAKYVVDMFVYRFGKGLISLILIFFQSPKFVNTLLFISLLAWLCLVAPLFKKSESLKTYKET